MAEYEKPERMCGPFHLISESVDEVNRAKHRTWAVNTPDGIILRFEDVHPNITTTMYMYLPAQTLDDAKHDAKQGDIWLKPLRG
jgi:hypothetical protein